MESGDTVYRDDLSEYVDLIAGASCSVEIEDGEVTMEFTSNENPKFLTMRLNLPLLKLLQGEIAEALDNVQ